MAQAYVQSADGRWLAGMPGAARLVGERGAADCFDTFTSARRMARLAGLRGCKLVGLAEVRRQEHETRLAEARAIVAGGKCPRCGRPIRRNNSMTGWWQCSQLGAVGFRADASLPSCDWQTFIV